MTELFELPQIVVSRTGRGLERAIRLFRLLSPVLVPMSPEEAELAKLFANAWRYVSFATANEMYAIANDRGLDYERIRQGLALGYQRGAHLPRAGFAAGPCLPQGHQLASGRAWRVQHRAGCDRGERGPGRLPRQSARAAVPARRDVRRHPGHGVQGRLGRHRDSLSYRLKRLLADRAAAVLCTDPLVTPIPIWCRSTTCWPAPTC